MGYAELTDLDAEPRLTRGWSDADLAGGLSPTELIGLEALEMSAGVPWGLGDLLAVGVCGGLGAAAAHAAERADAAPAPGAADDAFALLRLIRAGRPDVVSWAGALHDRTTRMGTTPVAAFEEAWVLWLRHLHDDALAGLGLPTPGWVRLFEQPVPEVRRFAHVAFAHAPLRPATGHTVPTSEAAILVEVLVRVHVHWQAYATTRSPQLDLGAQMRLEDMVRAAHALVAASALTDAATAGFPVAGDVPGGRAEVRPVVRAGLIAVEAVRARRARHLGDEAWTDPAHLPWSSPDAPVVAARLDRLGR